MTDEHALVARLRAGDEEAFSLLVRRYQPRLLRLARTVVAGRSAAEEVVQDTWLAVVGGAGRLEPRASFRTWLFHILLARARTAAAAAPATPPPSDAVDDERFDASGAWSPPPVRWADQVDDRIAADKLALRVEEILPTLPDAQRQVVVLRDVEGMTPDDVSLLLGLTDGDQRALLHRARATIRAHLAVEMGAG